MRANQVAIYHICICRVCLIVFLDTCSLLCLKVFLHGIFYTVMNFSYSNSWPVICAVKSYMQHTFATNGPSIKLYFI
jgi:hypothetical protein